MCFHSDEVSKRSPILGGRKRDGAGPGGGGTRELASSGNRVSAWEDETVLEMDGSHGLQQCVLNATNPLLKMARMVNFILRIFYHTF